MDGLIEPYLIKAISLLHSSAKDSGDQLKSMLDEAIRLKNETNNSSSVSKLPPPLTMIKRVIYFYFCYAIAIQSLALQETKKKNDFFYDEDVPLSKRRKESPRSSPSSRYVFIFFFFETENWLTKFYLSASLRESRNLSENMTCSMMKKLFLKNSKIPLVHHSLAHQLGGVFHLISYVVTLFFKQYFSSSPRHSRSPSVARKSDDLDSLIDADDLAQEIMDLHCVICK
jgi:hypothetical protein